MSDVIVVGGSVAGSAVALALRERGLSVVVLEKERFPRDKPCGEGIMPTGAEALVELGLSGELQQAGAQPLDGIAWHYGGHVARAQFPGGRRGLCVRRWFLDKMLARRTERAGAERHENAEVRGVTRDGHAWAVDCGDEVFQARFLVGADGPRSTVSRLLGLEAGHGERTMHRFGVRQHFRLPRAVGDAFVHVHFVDGAEVYVTPAGPDVVNVACLVDRRRMGKLAGGLERGYRGLVAGVPEIDALLREAEPVSEARACGPLRVDVKGIVADGALLVGDAAGYIDAITGEGVSLALRCAPLAAEVIAGALRTGRDSAKDLMRYSDGRRVFVRTHEQVTKGVLFAAHHLPLLSRVVRSLERRPDLFSRMLGVNDGQEPLWRAAMACGPGLVRAAVR